MANFPPPGVFGTSNANLLHNAATVAGTNTDDIPTAAVQFELVATAAANSMIADASPLPGMVPVDNPSANVTTQSSITSSTTLRGTDKHPALNNVTTESIKSFFRN